jgi:hypothetical protein
MKTDEELTEEAVSEPWRHATMHSEIKLNVITGDASVPILCARLSD